MNADTPAALPERQTAGKLVVAITGPAGSGKSTVAGLLAKRIPKCVNIDADHVKHFIVNGFIYDDSQEGVEQWELLGKHTGMLTRSFQEAGYHVIINGYINVPACEALAEYVALTHKFLLIPDIEVAKKRDKQRKEEFVMGEEALNEHYSYFTGAGFFKDFTQIDSTQHTSEQTAQEIQKQITRNWGDL